MAGNHCPALRVPRAGSQFCLDAVKAMLSQHASLTTSTYATPLRSRYRPRTAAIYACSTFRRSAMGRSSIHFGFHSPHASVCRRILRLLASANARTRSHAEKSHVKLSGDVAMVLGLHAFSGVTMLKWRATSRSYLDTASSPSLNTRKSLCAVPKLKPCGAADLRGASDGGGGGGARGAPQYRRRAGGAVSSRPDRMINAVPAARKRVPRPPSAFLLARRPCADIWEVD
mmetsp:Transcript_18295/g.57680  ORF Transcript_18295/g.57680 Transcript_18295/m.57680 type:complete len:229 (-) Transcript_18295:11-697(-)